MVDINAVVEYKEDIYWLIFKRPWRASVVFRTGSVETSIVHGSNDNVQRGKGDGSIDQIFY